MGDQLAVLLVPGAGRRGCVEPRLALNIVFAGEGGLQEELHGTGHGPARANRAGHLFYWNRPARSYAPANVAAARDDPPIRSVPAAESVLRPPLAAGHGDRRRHRIKSSSLPIRYGAIRFKTATSQRINVAYNTHRRRDFTAEVTPILGACGEGNIRSGCP